MNVKYVLELRYDVFELLVEEEDNVYHVHFLVNKAEWVYTTKQDEVLLRILELSFIQKNYGDVFALLEKNNIDYYNM